MARIFAARSTVTVNFPKKIAVEMTAKPILTAFKNHGFRPVLAVWGRDRKGVVRVGMVGGKPLYANGGR